MGWYMDESSRSPGHLEDDAEAQYLAYHEGRTGYANQSYLGKPWLVEVAAAVGHGPRCTATSWPTAGRRRDCLRRSRFGQLPPGRRLGGDVEQAGAQLAALRHLAQDHRGLRAKIIGDDPLAQFDRVWR